MATNESSNDSTAIATTATSANSMKCIVIQQTFTGKRELKVTTVPKPSTPADGEVLIAVKAW
jgi:hypothetical protein